MYPTLIAATISAMLMGSPANNTDQALLVRSSVVDPEVSLPSVPREFRAAWVATVDNIDWPSKKGLPGDAQQAELIAILDKAVALNLNAIILQVRCAGDALYESKLEPWSGYLSGQQGVPPKPFYDPLAFAIKEAHARGLELHAWFNPFRAQHPADKTVDRKHVIKAHPDWIREYDSFLWLDPGEPEASEHSLAVIRDVVRRYDIDSAHVDDYFYPYPVRDDAGDIVDFPDDESYQRYQAKGGKLDRADWRRDNINRFMKAFFEMVRQEKPKVKVGISPFGIWRPGHPKQIQGFDPYERIYADAKLWLQEGWLDYFVPQIYWRIDPPEQSYPVLMHWWAEQNTKQRHLWIGQYLSSVARGESGWPVSEVTNQINLTRAENGATGNVFFSMKSIMQNQGGLTDLLQQTYAVPALVPESPWLDSVPPDAPEVNLSLGSSGTGQLKILSRGDEDATWWVIQTRYGQRWDLRILAGSQGKFCLPLTMHGASADLIAVRAVDGCGNLSEAAVIR